MTLVEADRRRRWLVLAQYRQRLVALARIRGAGADAEDVAHHALLQAAERVALDELRPWPYLVTIASNRIVDLHRRALRDLRLRQHAGLVPRQRTFEDCAEERTDLRRVLGVLHATENPETVALMLGRAHGLTWHELAQQAGRTPSAVEAQVRRARSRLRVRLGWGTR